MLLRVLAVALAAVPLLPPTPAHADPGALTWTVQPANATAPDGRRWIERTLDAGQQITEHLAVRNLSGTGAVLALSAADGYLTGKGRFNMLASDQKSTDGGTWIAVQPTVTVGANETRIVPFTVTVPAGATPGDHPAGIAASVLSSSGTVRVESRVGFRVMMRVSGTATAALTARDLTAGYERSWNPLRPGALRVGYTIVNTGNVQADARAGATVTELFGRRTGEAAVGELLPGGSRAVTTTVGGVWGLGRVRATLVLTPQTDPVTVEVTVWVVPWPQLIAAVLLIGLLLGLRAVRRTRRRRLARLLEDARREGRDSALASA